MSVFAIKQDQEYTKLIQRLESHVNDNNKIGKGKDKEIEQTMDEVEFALHELYGNKQFDKSTYLKLKLQKR